MRRAGDFGQGIGIVLPELLFVAYVLARRDWRRIGAGALIAKSENGFMLIKDRDLKRLAQIPREWIVALAERRQHTLVLDRVRAALVTANP